MMTTAYTTDAPGCRLSYDVHGDLSSGVPLFLLSSPMAADGFATLATYFEDRPVVTYDPRGSGRSPRTDDADENQVAEHADDIRRVIEAVGVEAVDIFASSGGATNALALVEQGVPQVRTLVAHEPPMAAYLPDRDTLLASAAAIRDSYHRNGFGPAMAKFLDLIMLTGPLPEGYERQPPPDPASFGMPTEDDGRRDDPMVGLNMRTVLAFKPDLDALRAVPTRVVVAFGTESRAEMTGRAARALASQLDIEPVEFPSHHGGFLGGEYGQTGQPEAFAARLRTILDQPT
jgi:pimeloyl-ACP methyl ester carboxylesterase